MLGPFPDDLTIRVLPNNASTNHGRNREFAAQLSRVAKDQYDRVVGFDKLPGLDVLYCADRSIIHKRRMLSRLRPRYRALYEHEEACFAPGRATRLMLLSDQQREEYCRAWNTEPERITVLPPNIDAARRHPEYRTSGMRIAKRAELGIAPTVWLWLAVGAYPHQKGFDHVVEALRRFPKARVVIVGSDEAASRSQEIIYRARQLGVSDRLLWLGHREDVPELMAAADLLIHPARVETTGTVILEAVINGLPVVTTKVCGYANHVVAGQAGVVIEDAFDHDILVAALNQAAEVDTAARWSANGLRYGENPELYLGHDRAAAIILERSIGPIASVTN
jgi:UDP-glucose:(heptosyl)LPS alpha-1,3-glucosyltransferase